MEIRPGSTQAEIDAKVEENGRLRLLEREYWNVVDGGVEELEVRRRKKERKKERKGGGGTAKEAARCTYIYVH